MDTINERFLTIRKEKRLSQEAIGGILHISGAAYSRIETGINNPSAQTLSLLCSELSVNKDWLLTGNGSMFRDDDSSTLACLASEYHLDGVSQTVLASFLSLNAKNREVVLAFVKETIAHVVTDNYDEIKPYLTGTSAPASTKTIEEEAAIEAEAYRQEYIQAKMRQTSSASTDGNESTAG